MTLVGAGAEPASSAAPAKLQHDPAFEETLGRAVCRLRSRLRERSPFLAELLLHWMTTLAAGGTPEQYFTHPAAFPTMVLPWWVEECLVDKVDRSFQEDLIYSSLCGYYGIRLVDNVMDEGDPVATGLLPTAALFQQEFQATYTLHFPAGHPFWTPFEQIWAECAEATVRDAQLTQNDPETFAEMGAQKVSAALIPMLAVCFRHGLTALPSPWLHTFTRLCHWHQFHNDFFDCGRDFDHGTHTWFLSEWQRRGALGELLMSWVVREGFDWGLNQLLSGLSELTRLAEETGSEPLQAYLHQRRELLQQTALDLTPGLEVVRRLLPSSP